MTERERYLKEVRCRQIKITLTQVLLVVGSILLWEILTLTEIVDPFIFSSPSRIVTTIMDLDSIFYHIAVTLWETILGFVIGTGLGFIIAGLLWFSPFLNDVSAPFLVVLNSLPKIALGPVISVWAGAGMGAIIVMAVAISLVVTVLELAGGFVSTDKALITTVESFGATKRQMFYYLILPYNIPVLFRSLKVNIGLSLVGVIAGEFLVSKAGLGYLIVYAGQVFKMDLVMSCVFILGIIAFLMYKLLVLFQFTINKYVNHNV